ncbi:zinc finger protein Pegasus-like [Mya arenaria]|uniref:zinc finger protein Pegasus-like n=1 Tax=Mya arenaria TaxID=6604 RepID=UPI0022E93CA3|nr:zinc finger protein Pegasus-like [Mya arenaria]
MNRFANGSYVYRCRQCEKIGRKWQILDHALKAHVPVERVPYFCQLCKFRCQDLQTLLDHTSKYKRHTEIVGKNGPCDLQRVLLKSLNPIFVGEDWVKPMGQEVLTECLSQENPLVAEPNIQFQSWILGDERPQTTLQGLDFGSTSQPTQTIQVTAPVSSRVPLFQDISPFLATVASPQNQRSMTPVPCLAEPVFMAAKTSDPPFVPSFENIFLTSTPTQLLMPQPQTTLSVSAPLVSATEKRPLVTSTLSLIRTKKHRQAPPYMMNQFMRLS